MEAHPLAELLNNQRGLLAGQQLGYERYTDRLNHPKTPEAAKGNIRLNIERFKRGSIKYQIFVDALEEAMAKLGIEIPEPELISFKGRDKTKKTKIVEKIVEHRKIRGKKTPVA